VIGNMNGREIVLIGCVCDELFFFFPRFSVFFSLVDENG
jgi:hypothetical protein